MAERTAKQLNETLALTTGRINATIKRCGETRFPTAENQRRVNELTGKVVDLRERIGVAWDLPVAAQRDAMNAAQAQHNLAREALAGLENDLNLARHQLKDQPALEAAQRALKDGKAQADAATKRYQEAQASHNAAQQRAAKEPPSQASLDLEKEAEALLTEVGKFERELDEKASTALATQTKAGLAFNDAVFKQGELDHARNATVALMFAVNIAVAVIAATVALIFIGGGAGTGGILTWIAARVALLLFGAWIVRWFARLYQAHQEQRVIYRDRRAALAIAKILIDSAGDAEERRQTLKSLESGYLNFDQSAFRNQHENFAGDLINVGALEKASKAIARVAKALPNSPSPTLSRLPRSTRPPKNEDED
jgi:hypothetical protein